MAFNTFLEYFRRPKAAASVAKERLSVIVARERASTRGGADYLPQLQQEILAVLAKYEKIDLEHVSVKLDKSGDCDVLELNVIIPDDFNTAAGLSRRAGPGASKPRAS